ncbi:hypothetical protein ACVINI_001778 [Rhizobium beringeri]
MRGLLLDKPIPSQADKSSSDALPILGKSDVPCCPGHEATAGAMSEDAMQCARTVSFASAAMMALTIADASLAAEKVVRLKSQEAVIRSDHVLMVPLDAMMTPPIFSISWWSRVKPASSVDPPAIFSERPNEVTPNTGGELNDLARRPE